jgi:integrase/recombinase XerD
MKDDTKTTDNSKEAFIYLWRDSLNKKWYLGKHKGSPDDRYTHSSHSILKFKKEETPSYMKRKVLAFGTNEEICVLERRLLRTRIKKKHKWNQYHNKAIPRVKSNDWLETRIALSSLSDDDLARLFELASTKKRGNIYRIIIALSFYAGLKAYEIMDVQVTDIYDVNMKQAKPYIKIGEDSVPVNNLLKCEINKFIASIDIKKHKYVCMTQKKQVFTSQTLQGLFRTLYNELGIDNASSHTGRNTFISKLLNNNIRLDVIQKLARHKSIQQTARYLEMVDKKDLSDVLDLIWNV